MKIEDRICAAVERHRKHWRELDSRIKAVKDDDLERFIFERVVKYEYYLAVARVHFDERGRLIPGKDKDAKVPGGGATLAAVHVYKTYVWALFRLWLWGPAVARKFLRENICRGEAAMMGVRHREASEAAAMSLSGFVAANTNQINRRLFQALATYALPAKEALHMQLPGAVRVAWAERPKRGLAGFPTRVLTMLEDDRVLQQDKTDLPGVDELPGPEGFELLEKVRREEDSSELDHVCAKAELAALEGQIIDGVRMGRTNREIADALDIEVGTVSKVRYRAMVKLRRIAKNA